MKKRFFIICLAVLVAAVMFPVSAAADTMDTRDLARINKPGVVMVYTEWTATMTLREFSFDNSLFETLQEQIVQLVKSGQISADDNDALYSAIVQLLITQMESYAFYTGNSETMPVSTGAVGTGFLVTPDGYLVTNAHVVETNEDELYYSFAVNNLNQLAETSVNEFIQEFRRLGYQMSQDEIDAMYTAMFNLLADSFDIGNLQTSYICYQGNVQPGSEIDVKGVGMDLRKTGVPSTSKDVAILKMDGSNLPTVTLGDDNALKTGDQIYAMGYPAVATVYGVVEAPQAMQEPTLTQGIVSARKQWNDGGSVIQMDAAIHGGNSGGPLFNADGEVVGINTFGLIDPNTDQRVAGMNFAVPISTVKVYLNELNITPSESKFTSDFKAALSAYKSGDYNAALDLLHSINDINPGFPVVQDLLAEAREGANNNPSPEATAAEVTDTPVAAQGTPEKTGISPMVFYIGGGVLLVIIAIAVILLMRKKTPAMAAAFPEPQSARADVTSVFARCAQCETEVAAGTKFCPECGAQIPALPEPGKCPNCGQDNAPGIKFCSECGTKLS